MENTASISTRRHQRQEGAAEFGVIKTVAFVVVGLLGWITFANADRVQGPSVLNPFTASYWDQPSR